MFYRHDISHAGFLCINFDSMKLQNVNIFNKSYSIERSFLVSRNIVIKIHENPIKSI